MQRIDEICDSILNENVNEILLENEENELFRDNWAGLKNAWKNRGNKRGFVYNFNQGRQNYYANKAGYPQANNGGSGGGLNNPPSPNVGGYGGGGIPNDVVADKKVGDKGKKKTTVKRGDGTRKKKTTVDDKVKPEDTTKTDDTVKPEDKTKTLDVHYTYMYGDDQKVMGNAKDVNVLKEYLTLLNDTKNEFLNAYSKGLFGKNDNVVQFQDKKLYMGQWLADFRMVLETNANVTNNRINNFKEEEFIAEMWNPKNLLNPFYAKNNQYGFVQKTLGDGRGQWMVSLRKKIANLKDKKYINLTGEGTIAAFDIMIQLLQRKRGLGAFLMIPIVVGALIASLGIIKSCHQGGELKQTHQDITFNYAQADPLDRQEQESVAHMAQQLKANGQNTITYHIRGGHNIVNGTVSNVDIYKERAKIINNEFAKYGITAQWDGNYNDNDPTASTAHVQFNLTNPDTVALTEQRKRRMMDKIIRESINNYLRNNII